MIHVIFVWPSGTETHLTLSAVPSTGDAVKLQDGYFTVISRMWDVQHNTCTVYLGFIS